MVSTPSRPITRLTEALIKALVIHLGASSITGVVSQQYVSKYELVTYRVGQPFVVVPVRLQHIKCTFTILLLHG